MLCYPLLPLPRPPTSSKLLPSLEHGLVSLCYAIPYSHSPDLPPLKSRNVHKFYVRNKTAIKTLCTLTKVPDKVNMLVVRACGHSDVWYVDVRT